MDLVEVASTLDLSQLPLVRPPSGTKPNFENPLTCAPSGKVMVYTTWSLMVVFFVLRIYTRTYITRSLGADDYPCIATVACVTAQSGLLLSMLGPKIGPHGWDVPMLMYTSTLKFQRVFMSLYLVCTIFLKSSVIFFNIILLIVGNTVCKTTDIGIIRVDNSTIAQIIEESNITQAAQEPGANATALMYTAIETWMEGKKDGQCEKTPIDAIVAQGIFSAATDFYVLGISIWLTLSIQLSLKRKIAVCAVFLVGLLACACSLIGAYNRALMLHNVDYTWLSAIVFSVGVAEHNIGIISASTPVVPILCKHCASSSTWLWFPTFFTPRKSTNPSNPSFPENSPLGSREKRTNWVQIPRATLTGLRSLISIRSDRTLTPRMVQSSTYIEVGSVSEEYHRYMRPESSKGHLHQLQPE
ncbi:hypothetical protein F4806DRAFT_508493 [Annulohypoxylon nitens]|nr:hypothetical protein F4806DRAFT_508493 [Annulohypoxylon nitens]